MTTASIECQITITDLTRQATEMCLQLGLTPVQAARHVDLDVLTEDDIHALAAIGLARLVNKMMDAWNTQLLTSEESTPEESVELAAEIRKANSVSRKKSKATAAERREVLYRRTRDALDCRYVGADGVMKALAVFTVEDHRFRLRHCDAATRGWKNSSRFHHDSLTALKTFGAQTIEELPEEEQDRLRGRLR